MRFPMTAIGFRGFPIVRCQLPTGAPNNKARIPSTEGRTVCLIEFALHILWVFFIILENADAPVAKPGESPNLLFRYSAPFAIYSLTSPRLPLNAPTSVFNAPPSAPITPAPIFFMALSTLSKLNPPAPPPPVPTETTP